MNDRVRRCLAVVLTILMAVVVAACGGSQAGDSGRPRLAFGAAAIPASLDPRQVSPYDAQLAGLLYDSLIKRDTAGAYQPGLATEWALSEDLLSLDLTLRTGVTFQDGAPFDAAAVKANLDAAKDPATTLAGQVGPISKVEVVDDTHVRLRFSEPFSPILGVLAGEAGMMISPAALGSTDKAKTPPGAGPFTLDSFNGGTIRLSAWDGYWNKDAIRIGGIDITVFLDESARMRALRSGQIDVAGIQPQQIPEAESGRLQTVSADTADFWGVIVNTGHPQLGNPDVRRAMMLAIDRRAIADNVFAGGCTPSAQPFSPGDWANRPELDASPAAQFDPARAKQLLAEAGVPDGFSFELQSNTSTTAQQLTQVLQAQWAAIGIDVVLKPMENVQFVTARRNGEFEATMSVFITSRPDQSQFVKNFYLPDGIFNPGDFEVPGTAEQLAAASASSDVAVRQEALHRIVGDVLEAGPPVFPICARVSVWAFREGVQGVSISPLFDPELGGISVDRS
jgi:peptide/nickel transport system substrate-binding protein